MKRPLAVSAAIMFAILLFPRLLPAVEIKSVSGNVAIQRRGSDVWSSARPKLDLAEGDKIKTGAQSWALISQLPAAKIVLRQNAIVSIESTQPQKWIASLEQGGALVMLKDRQHKQAMSVRTRGGVVGTEDGLFELETEDDNSVQVFVMEGELLLRPTMEKQTLDIHLAKGQTYLLRSGAEPVTLAVTPPAESTVRLVQGHREQIKSEIKHEYDIRREVALFNLQDSWQEAAARDVQTNQYEEGHISVDSTGHRYRREDYLLRPSDREFTYVTLNTRAGQKSYTKLDVVAANPLPKDLSGIDLYQSDTTTPMSNWAVRTERISSNGTDYYREWQINGSPVSMDGTIQDYWQVVFSDWYIEYKGGALSPILLTHWVPTAGPGSYSQGNPVDTVHDADVQANGIARRPRGYVDFGSGTIGDNRPIDSAGLTVAQRLDTTNSSVANLYANSEGYPRTAMAYVDDAPFNNLPSLNFINNSTKTSRISTYTLPNNATITLRSDRYYLNSESQRTRFSERQNLDLDVHGLTLETNFSSSIGGSTIGSFINPVFFFQTDMAN